MSTWVNARPEDIELDGKELYVQYGDDNNGANYVVLQVADVVKLLPNKEEI